MVKIETRYWHIEAAGGIDLFRAFNFNHQFKHHFHEEWVIAIYEGGTEHCKIGNVERFTQRGDIHLIPPMCSHSGGPVDDEGWSYRTFYPSQTLIDEILGHSNKWPSTPTFYRSSAVWEKLRDLHILIEQEQTAEISEEAIISVIQTIESELLNSRNPNPTQTEELKEPLLAKKVRDFIDLNYEENLSITKIAADFKCSSAHLVRTFSSYFGIAPHAYMVQLRILKAKYALKKGATSVEAAIDAGFSDQPHMIRHFRRMFGVTPGHYIKNVQY